MLTILASIILAVLLWQLIAWRLFRVARSCVHRAVLATSQRLTLDGRHTDTLTEEERMQARAQAARFALSMLGRWRGVLLRLLLGRWSLSSWLEAEIESAVYSLKSQGALPVSQRAMLAHNPLIEWATTLAREFVSGCGPRPSSSGPPSPEPGQAARHVTRTPYAL